MLYRKLFAAYKAHPRHFLMRLLEELIKNNNTLLLQLPTEDLLYLLDNFVDNGGLLLLYLSVREEVTRDTLVLKIAELILSDERYFKSIDAQIDKADKELLTADKYGLKHRTTETILFGKAVYIRMVIEVVKFNVKQQLMVRSQDITGFKTQVTQRLVKNFEALARVNKSPMHTKHTELKRFNLELCWQCFKLDPSLLLNKQHFVLMESYFASELQFGQEKIGG